MQSAVHLRSVRGGGQQPGDIPIFFSVLSGPQMGSSEWLAIRLFSQNVTQMSFEPI